MFRYISILLFLQYQVNCHPHKPHSNDVLRGVVDILENQHKVGGRYQPYLTTYVECLDGCREDGDCIAVDYESDVGGCWFHGHESGCSPPEPQPGVKHIKLCDCTPGVSMGGGWRQGGQMERGECVKLCKDKPKCYGVDYNIRLQHCYHHFMDSICHRKDPNPDAIHYSKVKCRGSLSVQKTLTGKHVRGGKANLNIHTKGECISACEVDMECVGVDFHHGNGTCVMHGRDTECDPRFPLHGATHYQFESCHPYPPVVKASFPGQVLDDDGNQLGMETDLAEDEYDCILMCAMTEGCVAVDWSYSDNKCYILDADIGCNSVTHQPKHDHHHYGGHKPTPPKVVHHELTDCKQSGDVFAFVDGHHVRGGELKSEFRSRKRCLARCIQPVCEAADWDEDDKTCYHHSQVTACNVLLKKSACTHYRFTQCDEPPRTVSVISNSSRAEGGTPVAGVVSSVDCLEQCGGDEDCQSVDYNVITHECIKHDLDGSCRPLVTQYDWYNYRLADCSDVIPGAKNFTGMHMPGATMIEKDVLSGEECYYLCKYQSEGCLAADYDEGTQECYLHTNSSACEPLIAKYSCNHYRLTDCVASIKASFPNFYVPGGTPVDGPKTEIECFDYCEKDPLCMAFDFKSSTKECRLHNMETSCNPLEDASSWSHHKLYECHGMPDTFVIGTDYHMHIPGGVLVDKLPGPVACIDKCLLARAWGSECAAATFNFATNECWFHNTTTACNPLKGKLGCAHYTLYDCDNERTPFGLKVIDYPGYRRSVDVEGPQAMALTRDECINTCAAHAQCMGVDHSDDSGSGPTCLFHYEDTACGALIPDPLYTHYSWNDCHGQTVIAEAVMGNRTLPGGVAVSVSSGTECINGCTGSCLAVSYHQYSGSCVRFDATEACLSLLPTNGTLHYTFIDCSSPESITEIHAGSKWPGGMLSEGAMTKKECLEACVDADCSAFSFNYREAECYLHLEDECQPVIRSVDYQDFTLFIRKKAGCDQEHVLKTHAYEGFHVKDGVLHGQSTLAQCLKYCYKDRTCRAVDYNPSNHACWFHGADTCQDPLHRDIRVNHYILRYCSDD